jgi:RNA polymerase sigma-70 factor (ECF subfamily)
VDPSRFGAGGAWARPLDAWETDADDRLVAESWSGRLRDALVELPPRQREIVILRDFEGLDSGDVCDVLGISEGDQWVLLHRGRSRLRTVLESELESRGR